MSHHNLVHKFVPFASSDESSGCASSSGQRMGEARKVSNVAIEQGKRQKGGHAQTNGTSKRKVYFATVVDICHVKKRS